jgi:hypothetical protein
MSDGDLIGETSCMGVVAESVGVETDHTKQHTGLVDAFISSSGFSADRTHFFDLDHWDVPRLATR